MPHRPRSDRPVPASTYRLQLHGGFTFDQAAQIVPYLADLGVSHLYLSPILQAAPGSLHGYDVIDHTRINEELGGREGFERLAATARGARPRVPQPPALAGAARWQEIRLRALVRHRL